MKKLAVIGNGMLGSEVAEKAKAFGWHVSVYDLPEFDIRNRQQLDKLVNSADCIVNCAAYTNVDKAESEKEICKTINADAPGMLGEAVKATGKYLVHISTDFVFGDLKDTPQSEEDLANPLSVYGATKLEGERKLTASGCKCSIIRVQWSYGINGNNFISKILELAKKLPKLKVVDDQTGAPTHTRDMARAIMDFVENRTEGLYHFAAKGYTTRYEVAREIIRYFNLPVELAPCAASEFPAPAARPHNSKFNCSKIDKVLSFARPEWRDSLLNYLEEIS